jgi:bla regulator protein BlaR1
MNFAYFSALANHLWQSTVFGVVVALLAVALRHNGAATRFWLWMAASLKFLVPFALLVSLGNQFQSRGASPIQERAILSVVRNISVPFDTAASTILYVPPQQVRTSYIPIVVFSVWLFGSAVVLFLWLREWNRMRRIIRTTSSTLSLDVPITVLSTSARVEPGVVGILRPVLLLPEAIRERLTEKQFTAILAHEMCHVRRRDNLAALLHIIVETIFWFHPLVWWIERRMMEERERACDDEVLRLTNDAQTYAEGILNVCRHYVEAPVNCVSGVGGANLKKRIEYIMIHPMALNLNPAWKALLALAGIAAIALPMMFGILNAQTAPRAQFEVASIKKNIDGTGVSFGPVPGGRLIAVNNPAMNFITNAYSVRPYQVVNAPEWLRTDRYDIEAKTDATVTGAQMMPMLQVLLENRFKLKVHRETREMPVFYLTAANSGIKLQPSTTKCIQFNPDEPPRPRNLEGTLPVCNNLLSGNGQNMRWRAQNIDTAQMTGALSSVLGRHVIDKTGFTGRFDLNLEFSRDPTPADDATTAPSIITLLQGELGLNLDSGRSPVEVFVIDHIERPSEN